MFNASDAEKTRDTSAALDALDWRLLAAVQQDGALSHAEIGARIGLSPSQCSRRLRRLQEEGFIRGFVAVLDPERLGFGFEASVVVGLKDHSEANVAQFRDMIARTDEVRSCFAISGDSDYLLSIVARDQGRFYGVLRDSILQCRAVATVRTSLVLEKLKDEHGAPLRAR